MNEIITGFVAGQRGKISATGYRFKNPGDALHDLLAPDSPNHLVPSELCFPDYPICGMLPL